MTTQVLASNMKFATSDRQENRLESQGWSHGVCEQRRVRIIGYNEKMVSYFNVRLDTFIVHPYFEKG